MSRTALWDKYFFDICCMVATNSKCLSRKIGCVITTKDNTIISTGYNGPPRGVRHCIDGPVVKQWVKEGGIACCPRRILGYESGYGLKYCPAAHAETNAIFAAAREGWSVRGSTLYLNTSVPCMDCMKAIIQVGIDEVVCTSKGNFYDNISGFLVEQSGIKVREFNL